MTTRFIQNVVKSIEKGVCSVANGTDRINITVPICVAPTEPPGSSFQNFIVLMFYVLYHPFNCSVVLKSKSLITARCFSRTVEPVKSALCDDGSCLSRGLRVNESRCCCPCNWKEASFQVHFDDSTNRFVIVRIVTVMARLLLTGYHFDRHFNKAMSKLQ